MAGLGGNDERRLRDLKEEVATRTVDLQEAVKEAAEKSDRLEEARQSVRWWIGELQEANEEVATRTRELQDATKELETLILVEPHPVNISQDLVVEILKKLPVNALLRFRCVCKSWKQLISSKSFILAHLSVQTKRHRLIAQHHPSNNLLLLDPTTLPHSDTLTLTFSDEDLFSEWGEVVQAQSFYHPPPVITTLHGVNCHYYQSYDMDQVDDILLLCNPSTHQLLKIPVCYRDGMKWCSFWIDPSNNDFKIAIMSLGVTNKVDLFSSRNKAWAEVDKCSISDDISDYSYLFALDNSQIQIDGVAHWMASRNHFVNGSLKAQDKIFFFDFGEDMFGVIELPEQVQPETRLRKTGRNIKVSKWQDFVSVVHWRCNSPYPCDLWVMQNGSWSKMFSFNLNRSFGDVFCVWESWGRGLASTMMFNGDLVLYDSNGSRSIPVNHRFAIRGTFSIVYEYVESLVFPDLKCISTD